MNISDIKIGHRHRKDLGDLDPLARSIAEIGLLHPPVVDENNELIVGLRRIRACELLGWKEVPVRKLHLGDILRGEAEENVLRKEFTVKERVSIGQALEEREQKMAQKRREATQIKEGKPPGPVKLTEPEKGEALGKVAEKVGWSRNTYKKAKVVVEAAESEPEKYDDLAEKLRPGTVNSTFKELSRRREVEERLKTAIEKMTNLVLGDALDELKKLKDQSVDCVVIDPPYGVGFHPISKRWGPPKGDDESIFDYLGEVCRELYRVMKRDSHLYCFTGWKNSYCPIYRAIMAAGFDVANCIVWVKDQRSAGTDFTHKYAYKHEFIIFGRKGNRCLTKPRSLDVLGFDKVRDGYCSTQKPVGLLKYLIENSTVAGETVLDCFAGSGSTLVAAEELGRNWVGIEIDPELHKVAEARILGLRKDKEDIRK